MTGFLLTAKQKLMLCINKRLYRRYRCNGHSRTGQFPLRLCDAGPDRDERDDACF